MNPKPALHRTSSTIARIKGHAFRPSPSSHATQMLPAEGDDGNSEESPIREASLVPGSNAAPSKPSSCQLTIFYDGVVNVYDNVPADTIRAIMLLAGNDLSLTSQASSHTPFKDSHGNTPCVKPFTPSIACKVTAEVKQQYQRRLPDLPHARKASLTRFLERRRERVAQSRACKGEMEDETMRWNSKKECIHILETSSLMSNKRQCTSMGDLDLKL